MLDPRLEPHQCLCASTWMKWLTCHTDCQDISRYHTRGESVESVAWRWWGMQARESTLALKARTDITRDSNRVRCHQKSKIGVSVAHKKDFCPQFFKKKVWIKYVIEEDKSQKFDPVAKLIVLCRWRHIIIELVFSTRWQHTRKRASLPCDASAACRRAGWWKSLRQGDQDLRVLNQ